MSRAGLIGGLLLTAIIGFVVVQSFLLDSATCEVCMEYRHRQMCRTVGGANEEEAVTAAVTNACAFISSGVTDSMACSRGQPVSQKCW